MTNLNGGTLCNAEFGIRHRAAPYRKGQVLHSVFAAALGKKRAPLKSEIDAMSRLIEKTAREQMQKLKAEHSKPGNSQ
ncbi:hypothetical protein EF096_20325 [Pseudomonas neustonica]|uniref:Uncharacterized protein n=2 Tax=Pseudomonas TaxID=286 RepID=A0ABX9XCP8_9PSED|nr:hypothetical protein EF099_20320 [Pseudomonas sp. SSM44]ROZ79924.1 hypothetical protein EF096_20325 [Pseudomonas neustonica]